MSETPDNRKEIEALQQNPDYIIMNNPLASPKFVRNISKSEQKTITEIYTPKVFYEIVSQLKPEHLLGVANNQNITIDIVIKDFLKEIGAEKTRNYQHLITSIETLQTTILKWRDEKGEHRSPIVAFSTHDRNSSTIQVQVHEKLVKVILDVKEKGNFGFFKRNVHKLQNAQALKLYPFFKAWSNYGRYETTLIRFKENFGYNTSGYQRFAALEKYVLMPALDEINNKTDIQLSYQKTGQNLDGAKPRVTGLIFFIKSKVKGKGKAPALPGAPLIQELEIDTEYEVVEDKSAKSDRTGIELTSAEFTQLFELFKKITIDDRPDAIASKLLIDGYVAAYGKQAVIDTFHGVIDTKARVRSVAFFTPEVFGRYAGYESRKEEKRQRELEQLNSKKQQQQDKERMQEILTYFESREYQYFLQVYEQISDEQRNPLLKQLWETHEGNEVFFSTDGEPTEVAKYEIGSYWVNNFTAYNRRMTLQRIAERDYNTRIEFDDKNNPYFVK
ncbi:replication initiation protein [Rudanella lutea]|uniref:replication initiation protein n=1 Tax=Rudanella lutea TaxID=451374 RepID=UPI0003724A47|nr:replication initiation protein [Rudanella lutea]